MRPRSELGFAVLAALWLGVSQKATADPAAVQRGRLAVQQVTSPLSSSTKAFDQLWKQWGLEQRPEPFSQAVRERYGLVEHPDGGSYPLGLHEFKTLLGRGIGQSCLTCHAGRIAGQTILGLGNASIDLEGLVRDMLASEPFPAPLPLRLSNGRGIVEASAGSIFLMQFRDPELNFRATPIRLRYREDLCQNIPAWWLLKRKRTMYHTGSTDARSVRTLMSFMLAPIHSGQSIRSQEPMFADIKAYLLSIPSPAYPLPVDEALAGEGEGLFRRTCSRCHGRYGVEQKYPNRVVPLETIKTDPTLARYVSEEVQEDLEYYDRSWLYRERDADGASYHGIHEGGYQAPPLDGVWATAPYLHNGSVPTVYHLLRSDHRPTFFTRSFQTDVQAYDQERLGWKITVLPKPPGDDLSGYERRKIYDTTQPGRSNRGHTFGDHLSEEERMAVIEYLKTL